MEPDPETVARLRRGDRGALEACYRRLGARVYRVSLGILGQAADAEDATQEVFVKVFERARQFSGRSRFSTWVHRIAVHHALHRREKEALRRADSLADDPGLTCPSASPARTAERNESAERLGKLLDRLPDEQRAALVLRELEGLSYKEIAAVLEIPEGTVMSRLARARERLARLVNPGGGDALSNGAMPRSTEALQ